MSKVLPCSICSDRMISRPASLLRPVPLGELSCGMSILLEPEHLEAAKACIEKHKAVYHAIVPLEGQIKAKRDKYC